jgi:hypothetical protein
MSMNRFLLSSVAAIALTGALSLGAVAQSTSAPQQQPQPQPTMPNSSQDGGAYGSQVNSPQYSTPAEKQETRSLNDKASQGTTASPAVLNGQAPANTNNAVQVQPPQNQNMPQSDQPNPPPQSNSSTGPQSSNAGLLHLAQYTQQPAAPIGDGPQAQQQYDQQQQQYQQQQQQYQDQQGQYQDQQHRYYRNLREYDQAQWAYDYPAPIEYRYEGPHAQRLYLIAEPSEQLSGIPIEGSGGRWIGRERNVEIGPDGRPMRVEVSLNRRVSVWVSAGNFRFDPYDHVLMTNMTRSDFWEMPGATVESGPL